MTSSSSSTEDSFQITLPSNVCKDEFPENKSNSYKTKLFKRLDLPGRAEVALIDVQFPPNWPNVLESTELAVIVELDSEGGTEHASQHSSHEELEDPSPTPFVKRVTQAILQDPTLGRLANIISMPSGHYQSIDDLGKTIMRRWNEFAVDSELLHNFHMKFDYEPILHHARITCNGPGKMHFVTASPYLMETLFRFQRTNTVESVQPDNDLTGPSFLTYTLPLRSKNPSTLEYLSSIYVYSNLARYQLIGNTEAPLLGIVPIQASEGEIKTQKGDQQYYAFNPTYYIPLVKKEFDTIEIELKTDFNTPFPFAEDGNSRVVCRLHFRKHATQSLGHFLV